ncbi:ABC transporter substrate-binding protein [Catellatospora paridis]|uniref:ABC transporter substrate-binding protein n=1 Tax=Catellatospora paridis TaxID=1617086 RepID=UPI0012D3920C|nr:sugar ABC transporter substrate-binding protein [Catellatospora paridis]
MRTKRLRLVMSAVLVGALAAGCSSGGQEETPQETGPVELTFWTWAPNMDKIAAVWNTAHPDIKVTVSKQAGGDEAAAKFLTAAKAGNAPDLVQAEYQMLPSFVAAEAVADIKGEVAGVRDQFSDGIWNLVTLGTDGVYGLPQDSGPMMFYYRTDLFTKYGIAVPKTWDEYAAAARTVHAKDKTVYLGGFSSKDPGWFAGLSQQAGGQWWSITGEAWKVGINDGPTKKVADFWGGLAKDGVIDTQAPWTPEWNAALNGGKIMSWASAVWAPGVLSSNAPDGKGKWAIAPLPQWSAGENYSGFWGGSSIAIAEGSKHKQAAAQFASWLNTDAKALDLLIKEAAIYPAAKSGQALMTTAPEYFANQADFWQQATNIAGTARGFTFGPNVNVAYSAYKDAFDKALQNKSSFTDALGAMHDATVADMKKSGFTLAS